MFKNKVVVKRSILLKENKVLFSFTQRTLYNVDFLISQSPANITPFFQIEKKIKFVSFS